MKNSLARNFNLRSLLFFALPTIVMMVFMSLYTMVDGVFVSRFVGTDALSAVNIVFPLVSVVIAVGIMLATGASAILAKEMGQGQDTLSRKHFSFIILVGLVLGLLISVAGFLFLPEMLLLLGANEVLYTLCHEYTWVLLWFVPMAVLQMLFQTLFVTAGRPGLGLIVTVAGGVANIVLDYVFIVPMGMGISGAALATGIGYSIPAVFGVFYFALNRKGTLYFVKPVFDGKMLLKSCTNGSSEMVTNLSTAVTTYLFNILMLRYVGEDGVAAITIVLYAQYLLTAVFLGYSTGIAPVVSYNFGSRNTNQLKKVFKISLLFIGVVSLLTFAMAHLFSRVITGVFTPPGTAVFELTISGFHIFAFAFLFMGVNIFASALFTALSNGKVSALLSFVRTFVFIVAALLLLPQVIGLTGIWLAIPLAEGLGLFFSLVFLGKKRKGYGYA
ncbi:MATE family efflux transporter [Ruminococcaceae bacterium OttesenSCG-928-I18]|nr:MATE family efflux transporter [Ruminococcaceae bacterium OttesenSCG-928-I18]